MTVKFKTVTEFPKEQLSAYAISEFKKTENAYEVCKLMMKRSRCWEVTVDDRTVLLVGIARLSLVGYNARLWMVAFRPLRLRYFLVVRKLRRALFLLAKCRGPLSIAINLDEPRNIRFAEFLGFRRDGSSFFENGIRLQYFVLR